MNKVVMITGARGGIGSGIVQKFLQEKWEVVAIDRRPAPAGVPFSLYIQEDISTLEGIKKAFKTFQSQYKTLDCLVLNAAVQYCAPFAETNEKDWDEVMSMNLKSPFFMIQHALPWLKAGSERSVVMMSSVHARATSKSIAAYAISKAAACGLARSLSLDLANDQIRVNAILPGAIDTPMLREGLNRGHVTAASVEEKVIALGQRHPIGRVGQPKEIAEAVWFLARSTASGFMTGQELVVDGGALGRLSTEA
jgi:glucose 1-dehydrogenase